MLPVARLHTTFGRVISPSASTTRRSSVVHPFLLVTWFAMLTRLLSGSTGPGIDSHFLPVPLIENF